MSGGQQQRLCIARAIAVEPEVLLMDEPCSALDPIATARIEDLMQELKQRYTIVIVTHNMQQAARVSDRTAFFTTEVEHRRRPPHRRARRVRPRPQKIFSNPSDERTENYVTTVRMSERSELEPERPRAAIDEAICGRSYHEDIEDIRQRDRPPGRPR